MAQVMTRRTKFVLDEDRIPRAWYNIAADLPVPPSPPLHPGTGQPIGPDDLAPLFPMALIGQEVSAEPALPCPSSRARARYAGPHLLQVRGREPGREPQAEHRDPAGLVQPAG